MWIRYGYADDGLTTIVLEARLQDRDVSEAAEAPITMRATSGQHQVNFGKVSVTEALALLFLPCRLDYVLSFGGLVEHVGDAELQAEALAGGLVTLRFARLVDDGQEQVALTLTAQQRVRWYGFLRTVVPQLARIVEDDPAMQHMRRLAG